MIKSRMVLKKRIVFAVIFLCMAEFSGAQGLITIAKSSTETTANVENLSTTTQNTLNSKSYNELSAENTAIHIDVTVIHISKSTSTVDSTTSTLDSTTSTNKSLCSPPCYRKLGCFKLKRTVQTFNIKERPDQQVIDCMTNCKRSLYVGIQIMKQSDNGLRCYCLGNDLVDIRRKNKDRCGKTCFGELGLACGGKKQLISIYRRENQFSNDVKDDVLRPAGVELYILITIASLIGLSCVCALCVIGVRKWKQHQESNEYEDDHYYSYCQVPCNEMATSCSIEGSSNVTYLKNYPAKLPPPRKINRHSMANEASISEQVIPESDELEVTDMAKDGDRKGEINQNNTNDNEQYFVLVPQSDQKMDKIEDSSGYLIPNPPKPESNLQNTENSQHIVPSNDEAYSVFEAYGTGDKQYSNKLYNAMETNSPDNIIRSNDHDQQSGDGIYNILEKEIDTNKNKILNENS